MEPRPSTRSPIPCRSRALAVAIALGLVATGGPARASDDPLVTDRPDFTESAVSVAPGRVQVEAGVTLTSSGDADELTVGEVLARIGLVDGIELRVGAGSFVDLDAPGVDQSGWADPSLGVKIELPFRAPGDGDTALLVTAGLPAPGDLGGDGIVPSAVLAAGWDLTDRLSLGANLGYAHERADDERFGQLFASTALGVAASDRLGLFAELFRFSREEPGGDDRTYADVGATWLLRPDLQLDLRAGRGLDGPDRARFVGAGVAIRW